jgi:hypothetical protein
MHSRAPGLRLGTLVEACGDSTLSLCGFGMADGGGAGGGITGAGGTTGLTAFVGGNGGTGRDGIEAGTTTLVGAGLETGAGCLGILIVACWTGSCCGRGAGGSTTLIWLDGGTDAALTACFATSAKTGGIAGATVGVGAT